jgi:WD40 repeat protein
MRLRAVVCGWPCRRSSWRLVCLFWPAVSYRFGLLQHLPDLADPAARCVLIGHANWVTGAAIVADGTWLATTSGDQTTRIWDAATGRQCAALTGHTSTVTGVAIAARDRCSYDATTRGTLPVIREMPDRGKPNSGPAPHTADLDLSLSSV